METLVSLLKKTSVVAIKSAVDAWDVLQCSKAVPAMKLFILRQIFRRNKVAKFVLHHTVKVACSLSPVYTSTLNWFQIGLGQLCKRP